MYPHRILLIVRIVLKGGPAFHSTKQKAAKNIAATGVVVASYGVLHFTKQLVGQVYVGLRSEITRCGLAKCPTRAAPKPNPMPGISARTSCRRTTTAPGTSPFAQPSVASGARPLAKERAAATLCITQIFEGPHRHCGFNAHRRGKAEKDDPRRRLGARASVVHLSLDDSLR